MKIKNVVSLFKKSGLICLHTDKHGVQWIGDGAALYPLFNLPQLTAENIFIIFDIPEKKHDDFSVIENFNTSVFSLEDTVDAEVPIEPMAALTIMQHGIECMPFGTEQGIIFIDERYISPLLDNHLERKYFIRYDGNGKPYVAVKAGLMLTAIIMPREIIDNVFIKEITGILYQCQVYKDNADIL
jgi:hypothetical protein